MLAPVLTRTGAGAKKKVVDNKRGVMLRSLQSHGSTWLLQSIGASEPKGAYPIKKERENKMTKRNLWLVGLLLVFGLVSMTPSLFAQGTVWSASNNFNTIRDEGDAEAVGTITLTSTSTGTIESQSGFTFTYTLPIAYYPTTYAVGISCPSTNSTVLICDDVTVSVSGKVVHLTYTNTTPFSIFGNNSISVAVRVQSQGVANNTPVTASLTAFYKFGNQPLTLSTTTGGVLLTVAEVESPATTVTLFQGPEYALTCIGVHRVQNTILTNDFVLEIMENWNDGLTSLSDEYNLENNDSGYCAVGAPCYDGTTVYPTNGSNILITFSGLPYGTGVGFVGMAAFPPVVCQTTNASDAATYCAGGELIIGDATEVGPNEPYGPTVSFWYPVLQTNVEAIEWAFFGFKTWSDGPIRPNTLSPQQYQIWATVTLTDRYPVITTPPPNGDMPWFSLPELGPPGISVVEFEDCVTTLLFPYINTVNAGGTNNFSNFGTGIDIANTTWDPFALPAATCVPDTGAGCTYPTLAKGSAWPQSGSCTFYFYPYNANAGPAVVWPTGNLSAGDSLAFNVGTLTGFYNTYGYAIAICGFQNAYGFAFIWDANQALTGTGPTACQGYLAYVLPNPGFYHRTPAGDGLGESAIAPYDINKKLEKYLMGIQHHH
jgi:hypothetical protein